MDDRNFYGIFYSILFKNESLLGRFYAPEAPCILNFSKTVGVNAEIQISFYGLGGKKQTTPATPGMSQMRCQALEDGEGDRRGVGA